MKVMFKCILASIFIFIPYTYGQQNTCSVEVGDGDLINITSCSVTSDHDEYIPSYPNVFLYKLGGCILSKFQYKNVALMKSCGCVCYYEGSEDVKINSVINTDSLSTLDSIDVTITSDVMGGSFSDEGILIINSGNLNAICWTTNSTENTNGKIAMLNCTYRTDGYPKLKLNVSSISDSIDKFAMCTNGIISEERKMPIGNCSLPTFNLLGQMQ